MIRLDAEIMTKEYQEYLAVAEDLNLRIIEIVHHNGAIFSGPGKCYSFVIFNRPRWISWQEVDAKLEVWRQGEGLPFPDLSDSEKQRLKNTLNYPDKS